ncbi:hypothetical protein KKC59_03350, partial [bacterium]|nr:hypothetical protein [bacterium]
MKKIFGLTIFFYITFLYNYCYAEGESIEFTTYYPAPYGDYESIRSNAIEVYNIIVSPDSDNPQDTTKFKPVRFYNKIRILREQGGLYSTNTNYYDSMNVPEYIDIDGQYNRIVFYDVNKELSSGVFFVDKDAAKSYEQGLLFDDYSGSKVISIRNKGNIYLQPGFNASSEEGSDHAFYLEQQTRIPPFNFCDDGKVIIEGDLSVDNISSKNGERLFLVGPYVSSWGQNRSVVIADKIYINPAGAEVV